MSMYISNPRLPQVRMEAVRLLRKGWSTRRVARRMGFSQSAIVKWHARAPEDRRARIIPTRSSRPRHHPDALSQDSVAVILAYRRKYRRCAEVIHHLMHRDGIVVSLSSIKRTLRRHHLTYPSPWKKWHTYPPRPVPEQPGILVEIDTIVDGPHTDRLYIYTLLDVCSRFAYASPTCHANTHASLQFVETARQSLPFMITTLQSDHGSEFSKWFTKRIGERGMAHRHSRVRTPNDNAHLERFNHTIQEECLSRVPRNLRRYRAEIPEYLRYYNTERPHMGLGMQTPADILAAIPRY